MDIKIAHLYYDLMNLYGERGNVNVLVKTFLDQGINVSLKQLTINDNIDFDEYDVFIIGSGTESNQKIVLKDLIKYKDSIKKAVENDKFFLCTGNSIELFGKTITDINGKVYEGLNMFEYNTIYRGSRLVSEVFFKCPLIEDNILGFQNQGGFISDYNFDLFEVMEGIGSHKGSKTEGIHYRNFYGTYVLGPILARNPKFLEKFALSIMVEKNSNYRINEFNLELDIDSYQNFIKLYHLDNYKK